MILEKMLMDSRDLSTALETAIISIIFLAGLQAVRNIVAIPIHILLDPPTTPPEAVNVWFAIPTYLQTTPDDEFYYRVIDALLTQGLVRTIVLLFWFGVRSAFLKVMNEEYSMISSYVMGFIGVVNFWLLRDTVSCWSKEYDCRSYDLNKKLILENTYIVFGMTSAILAWNGIESFIAKVLYERYQLLYGQIDLTGVCFHVAAFFGLAVLKASRSLLVLGAEIDGSMKAGEGLKFDTKYFDCGCGFDCSPPPPLPPQPPQPSPPLPPPPPPPPPQTQNCGGRKDCTTNTCPLPTNLQKTQSSSCQTRSQKTQTHT